MQKTSIKAIRQTVQVTQAEALLHGALEVELIKSIREVGVPTLAVSLDIPEATIRYWLQKLGYKSITVWVGHGEMATVSTLDGEAIHEIRS